MAEKTTSIKLADIRPSPFNVRAEYDKEALEELAASIVAHGIIQPLVVRPKGDKYELVVGERRYRASKTLKGKVKTNKVPCIVRELTNEEVLLIQLAENLMREDLTVLEEARLLKNIVGSGVKEVDIAAKVGKSQPWVSDRIRLLKLPEKVHEHITRGILTGGHAKALLKLKDDKAIVEMVEDLKDDEWEGGDHQRVFNPTVRETERAVNDKMGDLAAHAEFTDAYKKAKVKKCPAKNCGEKATRLDHEFPDQKVLTHGRSWHQEGHSWDPATGDIAYTEREVKARKAKAKVKAEKKKTVKKGAPKKPVHVPAKCAWYFSMATKEQWAKALLELTAKDINFLRFGAQDHFHSYSGRSPTMTVRTESKGVIEGTFYISPIDHGDLKTKVTLEGFQSTPSKQDNVARGKEDVAKVEKSLKALLNFQVKKVGVKQTEKQTMLQEVLSIKLGAKVKVSKDFDIKSYQGAGATVIGFDGKGNAVLNYSKPDKVLNINYLEVVTPKKG